MSRMPNTNEPGGSTPRLVVIDPEDPEQVERLIRAIDAACVAHFQDLPPSSSEQVAEGIPVTQAALRSLLSQPAR